MMIIKNPRTEGKTCVYQHRRLDTNQIFYIGIGNTKRPHMIKGRNRWWKNITNKTNYIIEILYENLMWDEACDIEKSLILFYGRQDLKTGILVNLTDGGDGISGNIRTIETRKKIAKGHCGKIISEITKQKLRDFNLGKKLSEETKLKISLSTKGKNNHKSKPVINTITLEIYESATELSQFLNISLGTLYDRLCGRSKQKMNYQYLENYDNN